jgi:hypothetical protein
MMDICQKRRNNLCGLRVQKTSGGLFSVPAPSLAFAGDGANFFGTQDGWLKRSDASFMTGWQQTGDAMTCSAASGTAWQLERIGGAGLRLTRGVGQPVATAFRLPLLAAAEPPLLEEFQRSGSLMLRYGATSALPLEVLLQFRPWSLDGVSVVELVLSMQTALLDAAPLNVAEFQLPAGTPVPLPRAAGVSLDSVAPAFDSQLAAENRIAILTPAPFPASWLVVVHPGDLSWMSVESGVNGLRVECRLRAANLEKGVIRRMRLLMAVASTQGEPVDARLASMRQIADQFEQSDLPLSA